MYLHLLFLAFSSSNDNEIKFCCPVLSPNLSLSVPKISSSPKVILILFFSSLSILISLPIFSLITFFKYSSSSSDV